MRRRRGLVRRASPGLSDGVEAVIAWRLKSNSAPSRSRNVRHRTFPDPNGAIALHVAVTTHRTQSRAGFADLAAQQHQVDDLLNVRDGVAMLRQSHGPTEDRALGFNKDLRRLSICSFDTPLCSTMSSHETACNAGRILRTRWCTRNEIVIESAFTARAPLSRFLSAAPRRH